MSKIIKNTTISPINIADVGVTIPASPGSYTIPPQDYPLWAASNNIVAFVGSGDLVVNDGSFDLGLADGMALIQGNFPQELKISDNTNLPIHSVVDGAGVRRWAVDVLVTNGAGASNSFETISAPQGTSPVAESSTDTLNLTSSDGSIDIIGNASTDTIDFKIDNCKLIVSALIFG